MTPRIGIYAAFLDPDRTGGAEVYTYFLIRELQNLDCACEFIVFAPKGVALPITAPNFRVHFCDINPRLRKMRILWEQTRLPRVLSRHDLDLVHFPYGTFPISYRKKSLITIHDTMRFCFPHQVNWLERIYKSIVEKWVASSGHHVICVSKTDSVIFSEMTRIPIGRITVVYHGVPSALFQEQPHPGQPSGPPYLLWIGRPYPHKNLETLIEAYSILARRRPSLPFLRLVGVEPSHNPRLGRLVQRLGLVKLVSLEGPVPHAEVPRLILNSILFVYPSRYESFGLPVLEAMALMVPCLCADHPVFHELHGNAVAYADPISPERFAESLGRLLDDPAERRRFANLGREHALRFSWKKCAEETLNVYCSLLGRPTLPANAPDPGRPGQSPPASWTCPA